MVDFSLYEEIAKWIGWPAVSAVLILLVAGVIYFYNEYTKILKEKNTQLHNEMESSKAYSVDQLLSRMQERHKIAMEEIDRLIKEKNMKDKELLLKEKELEDIRSEKNGFSVSIMERIDMLARQVEVFKVESEKAKILARRKEVEVIGIMKAASEMAEDYRKKIESLDKE